MAVAIESLALLIQADGRPALKELTAVKGGITELGKSVESGSMAGATFGAILGNLSTKAFEVIASSAWAAAKGMIAASSEFEDLRVGLDSLTGSAEKGGKMLADLKQFALTTPFELKDLASASTSMLSYGFTVEETMKNLKQWGDIASASPQGATEGLKGVIVALGQMKAKGKVTAQEMNQLAERGVSGWAALAKELGVDIPAAMKKVELGQVPAERMFAAMDKMAADPRFQGLMEKRSKTFTGMVSNFNDAITQMAAEFGKPLFDATKGTFDVMLSGLSKVGDAGREVMLVANPWIEAMKAGASVSFDGLVMATREVADLAKIGATELMRLADTGGRITAGWVEVSTGIRGAGESLETLGFALRMFTDWDTFKDSALRAAYTVEFGFKNAGRVFELLKIEAQLAAVTTYNTFDHWMNEAGRLIAHVATEGGRLWTGFGESFVTVFGNAVNEVKNMGGKLLDWIKGGMQGELDLGLQGALANISNGVNAVEFNPFQFSDRVVSDQEKALSELADKAKALLGVDLTEFLKEKMAANVGAGMEDAVEAAKDKGVGAFKELKLASAAIFGSQDAMQAEARFRFQMDGSGANNPAVQQVQEAKKQTGTLKDILDAVKEGNFSSQPQAVFEIM